MHILCCYGNLSVYLKEDVTLKDALFTYEGN